MEKRALVCIGCPVGCMLDVELENGIVSAVSGNNCPIGDKYARKECVNPTRIVTSSVKVKNGDVNMVPVKTESDIPKSMIFDICRELQKVQLKAPVHVGDVVIENVLNTGVKVLATREISCK
ncbi:DUF1667 domain-containing protein [Clostridium frigidicarnis]|uniref:CxxC motif-containing protein n=1 Tax=Clostridium frigidicarnis TaxID=84698 RepID=A0A1I0WXX3_9CLOT|nr:DUF1667 domain-containing protein [Clostridium frigidicarnis]SFA93579.1 CxxC motif-containing protein [Clostridium frigidicarnis]